MALIQCEQLSLGYEGKTIVSDLNFSVGTGEYLCIVGENGSGKSTLMKAILGLERPLCGKITLGEGLKRNEIGYLPQQSAVQRDFPASVREVVLSGCLNRSGFFLSKESRRRAGDILERLEIAHLAERCYRELSGGQQQRTLLARALCAADRILLLDEPVAGLDPKATQEMYEIVRSLHEDGMTIIMISHDMNAVLRDATQILHICDRPLYFGDVSGYLRSAPGKSFAEREQEQS